MANAATCLGAQAYALKLENELAAINRTLQRVQRDAADGNASLRDDMETLLNDLDDTRAKAAMAEWEAVGWRGGGPKGASRSVLTVI